MKKSTLSVVIPLFNKAPYIERAIRSVLSQTHLPNEIIVVDDGSTDGGGEVVRAIADPRINLVRQENQGVSAARNRGIELSHGYLIAFLDADDFWRSEYLDEIMLLHQLFPTAGAFATAYGFLRKDGSIGYHKFDFLPPHESRGLFYFFFQGALGRQGITSSSVVIKKDIFEEIGRFKIGETISEHRDMWLRIALHYPVAWSNKPLVVLDTNTIDRQWITKTRRYVKEPTVSETARQAIKSGMLMPSQINILREYIAYYQMEAAHHCLQQGNKQEALKILEYAKGTERYKKEWRWYWTVLARLPFNLFPRYVKIKNLESSFRKKFLRKIF